MSLELAITSEPYQMNDLSERAYGKFSPLKITVARQQGFTWDYSVRYRMFSEFILRRIKGGHAGNSLFKISVVDNNTAR